MAEANGYIRQRSLSLLHQHIDKLPTDDSGSLLTLGELNGCGLEEIKFLGLQQIREKNFALQTSELIGSHVLDFGSPKVCPECLSEKRYIPFEWELDMWIGCPTHAKSLISGCTGCGQHLSWYRQSLDRCCTGFPLTDQRGELLSTNALDLMRVFARKAGLQTPNPTERLSNLLSASNLEQFCMLIKHLGLFGTDKDIRSNNALHRRHGLSTNKYIFYLAADILSDWPRNFRAKIDEFASAADGDTPKFRGAFYNIFYSLTNLLRGPSTSFISTELDLYMRQKHGIYSPALARTVTQENKLLTLNEVASALRIAPVLLSSWLASGYAIGEHLRVGPRMRWLITPSELTRLEKLLGKKPDQKTYLLRKKAVSQKEAIAILGVKTKVIVGLLSSGILTTYKHDETRPGVRILRLISEKSVRGLLQYFEDGAVTSGAACLEPRFIPADYKHINQLRAIEKINIVEIIETIIEHEIKPIAIDSFRTGLYRYMFSKLAYINASKRKFFSQPA